MAAVLSMQANVVAAASFVLALALGYLTTRAMRAACRGQVDVVDLELAGDFKTFAGLLAPLDDARIGALVRAHYWDCGFAIAYGIAICAALQWLALQLAPAPAAALYGMGWCGLVAGACDLLENLCLLRRFATVRTHTGATADGVLRVAAAAATLKFALVAFAFVALAWGGLQWIVGAIAGGAAT